MVENQAVQNDLRTSEVNSESKHDHCMFSA